MRNLAELRPKAVGITAQVVMSLLAVTLVKQIGILIGVVILLKVLVHRVISPVLEEAQPVGILVPIPI